MTTPPEGAPLVLVNTAFTKKGAPVDDDLPLADPAKTWWTIADVAAHYGVKPQTIRVYRTVPGKLPDPDETINRSPLWKPATIQGWKIPGPGRGYRSDLKDRDDP